MFHVVLASLLTSFVPVFLYAFLRLNYPICAQLVSVQSKFQRIDIYEVIRPRFNDILSYRKSLSNDGSYESQHPELYRPDRVVFLDGVMQSTLYGDEAYHEALVHPGMFAHPNPKRVAIIGGGEGATLREVLKHKTVETAAMIEIDEEMVNVSHEYLPSWSDCSSFSSADWCIEDPRVDVRYEDALAWFIDRFTLDGSKKDEGVDPFDVIIMDALDPQDNVPFAAALYDNVDFLEALFDAMTDNGVIVMQLGESPGFSDPADSIGMDEKRAAITRLLEEVGFESMHVYEESHSAFMYPWSYLVAFKAYETRVNWYLTEAEIEINIHERTLPTKDGKSPLKYFDGATMSSYQVPHKAFETVFCRESPMPEECEYYKGYDPEDKHAPASSFEVKPSGDKGFGLYAKVDIPKDYMLAPEETWKGVEFPPTTFEMMESIISKYPAAEDLEDVSHYMHFYGFQSQVHGAPEYRVDSGIMTFVNHGCDGSANMGVEGEDDLVSEKTADASVMPNAHGRFSDSDGIHHIAVDRHLDQVMGSGDYSMRDIKAGEEITNNYLAFTGDAEDWHKDVMELRKWCSGTGAEVPKKTE